MTLAAPGPRTIRLPEEFSRRLAECRATAATIEGFLKAKEEDFLFLAAAVPTAAGEILEIGSFRGRSTVILALGSRASDGAKVHACDPLPDTHGIAGRTGKQLLQDSLERARVTDLVEIHRVYSTDLAKTWSRPIRMLWIDGDHSLASARGDLAGFLGHLSPGAIVAMHDCLQPSDGPLRVFLDRIVLDPSFGRVGFCGSIGWGQYLGVHPGGLRYFDERLGLFKQLARLVPYHLDPRPHSFLTRKLYLLWRALVPHGPVHPEAWIASLQGP